MPWRRRQDLERAPVHQTQHHSPRTRGGGAAPPGGRRRASRRLYSVRTPRGWLGPARGEFLAPNSPLVPPPVLLAGFWAAGRARNPLDFVRWVVPIKARGRYTLCSAIHRAEGVRRVRNGDFWKSELFAKDLPTVRKRMASGQLSSPWEHARCDPWCIKAQTRPVSGEVQCFWQFLHTKKLQHVLYMTRSEVTRY